MNTKYFDSEDYFKGLAESNALALEHGFKFCTCSGINSLEGPLSMMRTEKAFFCLDDSNEGATYRGRGGGWFRKRTFTVFLLHRYRDIEERRARLDLCRLLMQQVLSRIIIDRNGLDVSNVMSRELGRYFMNGVTGTYFMVSIDEPVDLVYNPEEWLS